jgi:serine phosphatase RsbU (regulator of sigma subunit)
LLFIQIQVFGFFNDKIDSLKLLTQELSDLEKFEFYLQAAKDVFLSDNDLAFVCCSESRNIASELRDSLSIAKADYCIARSTLITGDVEYTLLLLNNCIRIFENFNAQLEKGDALSLKSISLRRLGESEAATTCLKDAILIFEENQNNHKLMKALINISLDYIDNHDYTEAFNSITRAKKINEVEQDKINDFYISLNFGNLYTETKNYPKAMENLSIALRMAQQNNMKDALVTTLTNIGNVYFLSDQYQEATIKYQEAIEKSVQYGLPYETLAVYEQLHQLFRKSKNYESALLYFDKYIALKDSMYQKEKLARITSLEKKLDVEKKEKELAANQLKMDSQQIEILKQKNQNNILFGVLSLVFVALVLIFKSFKDKQKANLIITKQKAEVENQRNQLEEKNHEILDSINYAKRIQQAVFKSDEIVNEFLPPHFIIFKPKDIVSGDFYWSFVKNNSIYVAVADCTGHGVPGAFMSMLGMAFLNDILNDFGEIPPAEVLDKLRMRIINELNQTGKEGENKDGMDISLCKLTNTKSLSSEGFIELQWAGANNPLWIVRANDEGVNELVEVKPDKQPIGHYESMRAFNNHQIKLQKGDGIYLFSDGYADQFGGDKGKKLKYKPFKELILSNYHLDMSLQKKNLIVSFDQWKGNFEQIDDICVIGIKL